MALFLSFHLQISAGIQSPPCFSRKSSFSDMGSCASAHKNRESTMKMPSSSMHSKPTNLPLPPPADEKLPSGKHPLPQLSSQGLKCRPRDSMDLASSRDDAYFDSQAWMESDCEDDFLSVNGDLTPSCGSTPRKRSSNPASPPLSKASTMDRRPTFIAVTSVDDKKTRLSELLKVDSPGGQPADNQDISSPLTSVNGNQSSDSANAESPPKSLEGSSDKFQNKDSKDVKIKSAKSSHCCIPNLVFSTSK